MEGKEAAVLGQDLLKVLLGHVGYLQQAVQVEAQYWQDPQTHGCNHDLRERERWRMDERAHAAVGATTVHVIISIQ